MGTKTEVRKINTDVVVEVSIHGGMLYVSLPKRFAGYHDIRIGDKLKINVFELKRERGVVEGEEIAE